MARVYETGGNVYGCAAGAARSYRLGTTGRPLGAARIGPVRVTGKLAAYGLLTSGVDTGSATVNVRRLTTGAVTVQRAATTRVGVEGFQSVDSLVLKADGAVAWVATAHSIGPPHFIRQLQKVDRRGFRLLDSGVKLAASSLRLHGSRLSWQHGTATRAAALQ